MNSIFFFAALFFFLLGVIGIFVPLLPTTPFLILSAALAAKSSPRFHGWLMAHKVFGPPIVNWQKNRGIALKHKITAVTMVVVSIGYSILFLMIPEPVKWVLGLIGGLIVFFLFRVRTL